MGKLIKINGIDNLDAYAIKRVDESGNTIPFELGVQKGIINIADQGYIGALDSMNGYEPGAYKPVSRMRSSSAIYIPAGASFKLEGLKGLDGTHIALRLTAVWYSSPTANTQTYVGMSSTPGSSSTYFNINTEGEDSAVITNNSNMGYWYMFSFRRVDSSSGSIDSSYYSPIKYSFL